MRRLTLNSDYKLRRLDNNDDISYLYDIAQEKLQIDTVKHSIITRETTKLKERYTHHIESRGDRNKTEESGSKEAKVKVTIEKD